MDLRESFADPGVEWRPVPFWFWNSRLDPSEIERQIKIMHEAGLGGFFIHARFGLETEYMDEEWITCVRRAVQVAHRYGLRAWLYDEYPFPSGVGGLKVTKNPENCNKFIDLVEGVFEGPGDVSLPLPDGEPILIYAVSTDQIQQFYDKAIKITPERNQEFHWCIPEGQWLVMIFVECTLQDSRGNVFGPDYLNPNMTQEFLNILDKYTEDEELKPHLGKTIPGIFTDEPCILSWHQNHTNYPQHHDGRIAAWGQQIPQRLRKMGYDWQQVLPAIFYDLGEESAAMRYAYRRVVADNYVESFFIPYLKWCEKHHLKLTGHLLLEEGLYTNTIFQGDIFLNLSLFDIPGTDHLGIGCENTYGGWGNLPLLSTNVQGQKLVSSVAHLYGKEAVLSESFGVSGWGLNLTDMKRIVDWQYRLGINFLCPHAFYYSLEGFRKHDAPPSQFFQATFWPYYRFFADYVARLSLLMRAGRHIAQVALFYPQDAFWSYFKAGQESPGDRQLEDQFDFYASELPRCHVDYDIVPTSFITSVTTQSGRLKIGEENYELIILPTLPHISYDLLNALSQFYQKGGKILLTEPTPTHLQKHLLSIPSPRGSLYTLGEMNPKRLEEILGYLLEPDVSISHRDITYVHRVFDGKHLYFFASDSNQPLKVGLEIRNSGRVGRWDLETGYIQEIPVHTDEKSRTRITWEFPPHGSLMLVIEPGKTSAEKPCPSSKRILQLIGDRWDFTPLSLNALPLDHWDIQYTAKGDWLHYDYRTDIQIEQVPDNIQLMLDDIESRDSFMTGMSYQILINQQEISPEPTGNYIDPKWKTFEIVDKIRLGKNQIHIHLTNQGWVGNPKTITITPKLIGNFILKQEDNGYRISTKRQKIKSGQSWTNQGYPFYSGTAIYSQEINLKEEELSKTQKVWVEITEVADVAEFIINGKVVAIRPWPPYRCEIRHKLRPGPNKIAIKITNSMQNFLAGETKASGLLGSVHMVYE